MRFYHGLTPDLVLSMPRYQVRILLQYMPALSASELQDAITAASAPYLAESQARQLNRHLAAQVRPLTPGRPPARFSLQEQADEPDPAKAAEWFAAHGAHVNGEPSHGQEDTGQEALPTDA